jgi:hypothetical protein
VTEYRLVAEPRAALDVAATFDWYEKEQAENGRHRGSRSATKHGTSPKCG